MSSSDEYDDDFFAPEAYSEDDEPAHYEGISEDSDYDDEVEYVGSDDDKPRFFRRGKIIGQPAPERQVVDYTQLQLKKDHHRRPLWVTPEAYIYLEAFSPLYNKATDFLIAIAEPKARPEFIHEYQITEGSLYAAVAVAIDAQSILTVLSRLSKNELPKSVRDFVREHTQRFGRAKLVLRENRFYVESDRPEVLHALQRYPDIRRAVDPNPPAPGGDDRRGGGAGGGALIEGEALKEREENLSYKTLGLGLGDGEEEYKDYDDDDDANGGLGAGYGAGAAARTVSFCVREGAGHIEAVRKTSRKAGLPLMEEYDFNADRTNADLDMNLKATSRPRDYQERALSKMFGNGRARSGIIVLPCGAGKTLTGISAACTIHKGVIVLCNSAVSAGQWRAEFLKWSNISTSRVCLYTREAVDQRRRLQDSELPEGACVIISTYSMMSYSQRRSAMSGRLMKQIEGREWGLMLLDEVHQAPAESFRRVMENVKCHAKLGLTATLVREDEKIGDLHYLIGPKLYEANWMDLTSRGYLAHVECIEVWCPMTKEFYREYLRRGPRTGDRHFYALNPNKFRVCEYLMHYHEARGDKTLVFCDDIISLEIYATKLERPWIKGDTSLQERQDTLESFRSTSIVNTIFISRVGDTSIDLPMANVLIQVNFHGTSRRQEAQRLGRILRPKPNSPKGSYAFFYTLVSSDTCEMYHSAGRQSYLVDQGYTYKVVTDLVPHAEKMQREDPEHNPTVLKTKEDEVNIIKDIVRGEERRIQAADEKWRKQMKRRREETYENDMEIVDMRSRAGGAVRRTDRRIADLSGVGNRSYMGYDGDDG
mmetsp:Transcript_39302/g.123063  ORF Transcript_39302/g.123063 Transcript_39302/m.123063 type:complete len:822 (-) Transcript_39302:79-2544(-)|eukprot:CAMPEP_0118860452 /NCGR_PEP_ID=MMETSP1163-20130328/6291_1 /TAXON_ID=124430 /ORGANISM="Phaeomonas parva, Strain CCMP2877" /LENGTH=821 /DNA_ID=CAMNT_0006794145 /DNA_START=147 /DNA_END=2612 /DNA_ORIENTATION=+